MDDLSKPEYMKMNSKAWVKPQLTEIPIESTLAKTLNKVENNGHPNGNAGASS